MTLTEKIRRVDLSGIIEAAGVVLSKNSRHPVGLCPFHQDRIPSFTVYDGHFHCFGCGNHGDAVDFVMKHYGFSFKEALRHLGIKNARPSKLSLQQIEEKKKKQIEKKRRIQRERDLVFTLGILIRATQKAMDCITPENFNDHCEILDQLSWWEQCHDVLSRGDQDEKDQIVEALKNMQTLSRSYLWKENFDYRTWNATTS